MTDREIANLIWLKIKNKPLPDSYTDEDADEIIRRYWHRAMESECYDNQQEAKKLLRMMISVQERALSMKKASAQDALDEKKKSMKKIINISDGTQKGKTTHILKETETCTEFVNINLVYEYNVVLEDVLQKAKQFNISCANPTFVEIIGVFVNPHSTIA